jgi:hypothetical protein
MAVARTTLRPRMKVEYLTVSPNREVSAFPAKTSEKSPGQELHGLRYLSCLCLTRPVAQSRVGSSRGV